MTKLPQEAKKYVELNLKTSNRTLADEIFQTLNIKTTHTTVGKEKKEILERMERKVERIEEKTCSKTSLSYSKKIINWCIKSFAGVIFFPSSSVFY